MGSSRSWGASKARQFGSPLVARGAPAERAGLAAWLTPAQLALFDGMPVADRRHALDVVERLRARRADDHDLLLAGRFHDVGKGRSIRLWPRGAGSSRAGCRAGRIRWRAWAIPRPARPRWPCQTVAGRGPPA